MPINKNELDQLVNSAYNAKIDFTNAQDKLTECEEFMNNYDELYAELKQNVKNTYESLATYIENNLT